MLTAENISHHSGFSSALRMEIKRLNEVAAIKEAKVAADAEKTVAEMAEKDKKLAALQALLMAIGILGGTSNSEPGGPLPVNRSDNQITNTPSRKTHSSQQLGGKPKDSRFKPRPIFRRSPHFTFRRVTSRQGSTHGDNISCKIRGLRRPSLNGNPATNYSAGNTGSNQTNDGTWSIKVEGCEYRIPKNTLLELFFHYGEIKSEITEDLFKDRSNPDMETDGTNLWGRTR
jgi:hypothetical protein